MRWRRARRERCDDVSVTSYVNNVTSLSGGGDDDDDDRCAVYRLCVRRRLLYHGVVLLGPAVGVTLVLLTLLASAPSPVVKLPATMAVVVVGCLLVQSVCSMAPDTLPVVGQ